MRACMHVIAHAIPHATPYAIVHIVVLGMQVIERVRGEALRHAPLRDHPRPQRGPTLTRTCM